MHGRYLQGSNEKSFRINIYADKSSLILEWLLREGAKRKSFSLRGIVEETKVSLGLAQKVLKELSFTGLLQVEGVRTAKKFIFKHPKKLIYSWLEHYNIMKNCKMWTYRSSLTYSSYYDKKNDLLISLRKAKLANKVALALHSAAEVYKCKNTNFSLAEFYLLDPTLRTKIENALRLEPQEKGYEVLLIEPYYKSLITTGIGKDIKVTPPLLTYLDLYHFPLRGREQAEFMANRLPELRAIT